MRVYFTSDEACILRLGGAFAGACSRHEKFADLDPAEGIVAEFFPEDPALAPAAFVLDEKFFASPPEACEVYRCGFCILLRLRRFAGRESGIRPLLQARIEGTLCTLYRDGCLLACAEAEGKFCAHPLPHCVRSARFLPLRAGKKTLAALEGETGSEEKYLLLFAGEKPVFESFVLSYAGGDTFSAVRALHDIAGHTAESEWTAEDGLRLVRASVREREGFDAAKQDARLIPFAFFETLLAQGDYQKYLAPSLLARAEKIGEYLGAFTGVLLPPSAFYLEYGSVNAAGLVYPKGDNLFDVRFFAAPLQEGKIVNILPVEKAADASKGTD